MDHAAGLCLFHIDVCDGGKRDIYAKAVFEVPPPGGVCVVALDRQVQKLRASRVQVRLGAVSR